MNLAHKNCKKNSPVAAVYLHIPFCQHKCPVCSFAVIRDRERFHEKYILGNTLNVLAVSEHPVRKLQ